MRLITELNFMLLAHHLFLLFFFITDELVLIEGEVFDTAGRLRAETDVNTSLVILHLLFGLKSLLAFNCRTLKLVFILDRFIMIMDISGR